MCYLKTAEGVVSGRLDLAVKAPLSKYGITNRFEHFNAHRLTDFIENLKKVGLNRARDGSRGGNWGDRPPPP